MHAESVHKHLSEFNILTAHFHVIEDAIGTDYVQVSYLGFDE